MTILNKSHCRRHEQAATVSHEEAARSRIRAGSGSAGNGARVEMDRATLERLLRRREVRAEELRCLDKKSKLLIRRLCLETCL